MLFRHLLASASVAATHVAAPSGGGSVIEDAFAAMANYTTPAFYDPSDLTSMFTERADAQLGDGAQMTEATVGASIGTVLDRAFAGDNATGLTCSAYIAARAQHLTTDQINFSSSEWAAATNWTYNGDGTATIANGASNNQANLNGVLTAGNFYYVKLTIAGLTAAGGDLRLRLGAAVNLTRWVADGTYWVICEGDGTYLGLRTGGTYTGDVTVSALEVKELPGAHLIAPSDAARPTLQTAGGLFYLDPDRVDDYYVASPVYDLGTIFEHIGGWNGSDGDGRIFATTNTGNGAVRDAGTYIWVGASGNETIYPTAADLNADHVLSFQYDESSFARAQVNGVAGADATTRDLSGETHNLALFTQENDRWGGGYGGFFYGGAFIPASVSGVDRALIETYVAELTGVTLP